MLDVFPIKFFFLVYVVCISDHVRETVCSANLKEINDDDGTYDLECLPRELAKDRIPLIGNISQFVVASLNSRFTKKIGVYIMGVRATGKMEKPFAYEGLPFMPDSSMVDGFTKRLGQTIFVRSVSDGTVRCILPQHLRHMVSFQFFSATAADAEPGKRRPGEQYFALLTVCPDLQLCANGLYLLSSQIDNRGRPKTEEVYKRMEGSSVPVQLNRVEALKAQIKEEFDKFSGHVVRH